MTGLYPAFLMSAFPTPAAVHAYRLAARQDTALALEFLASREVDAKLLKTPARSFDRAEAAFVAKVPRLRSERRDPPAEPLALAAE